eukprot:2483559-Pyramimonas_sp.AAC.1
MGRECVGESPPAVFAQVVGSDGRPVPPILSSSRAAWPKDGASLGRRSARAVSALMNFDRLPQERSGDVVAVSTSSAAGRSRP